MASPTDTTIRTHPSGVILLRDQTTLGTEELRRRFRTGGLRRITRGVYATGEDRPRYEEYRLRAAAAGLIHSDATVTGTGAAALHGLDFLYPPGLIVDVLSPRVNGSRKSGFVRLRQHRNSHGEAEDVTAEDTARGAQEDRGNGDTLTSAGIRTTSPAHSAIEAAMIHGPRSGLVISESALWKGKCRREDLAAAVRVADLVATLKAAGRGPADLLDDLARAHGLHKTAPLTFRVDDVALIAEGMARLRANPPATLAGATVTAVHDLSDGWEGLPPTDGLMLLTETDDRVIARPSGTEPKLKCYLEVIVPVAESGDVPHEEAAAPATSADAAATEAAETSANGVTAKVSPGAEIADGSEVTITLSGLDPAYGGYYLGFCGERPEGSPAPACTGDRTVPGTQAWLSNRGGTQPVPENGEATVTLTAKAAGEGVDCRTDSCTLKVFGDHSEGFEDVVDVPVTFAK